MIRLELRWLQTGDGHEDPPIEKELQYRLFADGSPYQWETVPTVTQAEDNVKLTKINTTGDNMKLEQLALTYCTYGVNNGKYTGAAKFENQYGSIELTLSPEMSAQILQICAEALVANSREVAANLTAAVIEQTTQALPAPLEPVKAVDDDIPF